jgi:hypothetical protein
MSKEIIVRLTLKEIKDLISNAKEIIVRLTLKEIKDLISNAFVHGQGNYQMMEAGLERDEREDYVNSIMSKIIKQVKNG